MSYILDALRRANADRERERGAVPSIHAPPSALGSSTLDADDDEGRPRWPLLAAAVMLAAGGAVAWFVWPRADGAPAAVPAPLPRPVTPAAAPVPAPLQVPAAPVTAAAAPPPAAAVAPPPAAVPMAIPASAAARPVGTPPAAVPAPAPGSGHVSGRMAASPTPADARSKPRPATPAPAPAGPDIKPAAPRVYAVSELPEDVRRSLPVLSIGGSIYAEAPRDRLLILGGRLFREGDQPAPELTIERIKPKAAEFSFRGYRYEVPF